MPINLKNIASRLLKARTTLGYSHKEIFDFCGISSSRLEAIESGNFKPSGDEILILANLYKCDFRALVNESEPSPFQQSEILFRRYGDSISAEDRRNIQEFIYFCQNEAYLEKILKIKKRSFSYMPIGNFYKQHGQLAAESLRSLIGYSNIEAPRDVYDDFRSLDIHIFRRKLDNDEISGLYIKDPIAGHCVLINYNEDIYRQRFSVSHEVAHAIFDSSVGVMLTYDSKSNKYDRNDLQEIRANSFASHYLMPITMLRHLKGLNVTSALHWAQEFRVSTAALAKALKDSNLIEEPLAERIRSVRVPTIDKVDPEAPLTLTNLQKQRRLQLFERGLSIHYVDMCFQALDRNLVTTARLAELLQIDQIDLVDVSLLFGRSMQHGV